MLNANRNGLLYFLFALIGVFVVNGPVFSTADESDIVKSLSELTGYDNIGYTDIHRLGNRIVDGSGDFRAASLIDIKLKGKPLWVVSAKGIEGSFWSVVLEDGRVQTFLIEKGRIKTIETPVDNLPQAAPPVLIVQNDQPRVVSSRFYFNNFLSHPVVLRDSERVAVINADGKLALINANRMYELNIDALPDARILMDEKEHLMVLTDPTTRYSHGIMGDRLEGSRITMVETKSIRRVIMDIQIEGHSVVEGLSPIWTDLNSDGVKDIIVTVSDANQGARIVVFNENGNLIGKSPAIGMGYRWRHQIAAGLFGPKGELELVSVRTPHIGGVIEYLRLQGNELHLVAERRGYTSHRIGSRNLDMAVAGNFDGDYRLELVVPNHSFTELGCIRRTESGTELVFSLPLDGTLTTNISAVTVSSGRIEIGVGREDGVLRVWSGVR